MIEENPFISMYPELESIAPGTKIEVISDGGELADWELGVSYEYIVPCDGIFKGFLPDGSMLIEATGKKDE